MPRKPRPYVDPLEEMESRHTYNSCNDDDKNPQNPGFNRCPRCTMLALKQGRFRLRALIALATKGGPLTPTQQHIINDALAVVNPEEE